LCGVQNTSILESSPVAFASQKLGQTLTANGFEAVALAKNGFPPQAVWLVIEYFAYDSRAEALMAKQIARTFGQIGITTTFDKLTEPVQPALPETDDDKMLMLAASVTKLIGEKRMLEAKNADSTLFLN
jgi:hypothetical protein